jgi:hypothetical protein
VKTTNKLLYKQTQKELTIPTKTMRAVIHSSLPLTLDKYQVGLGFLYTTTTAATATTDWVFDRSNMIAYHRNKL